MTLNQVVQYGGIIVALSVLIVLSLKGYSVILSAFLAAAIVALTNQMPISGAIFSGVGSLLGQTGTFISSYFLIFALGSLNAGYLNQSGAIERISTEILKRINRAKPFHGLMAVYIITTLLTLGGISLFVVMFAVVPLARHLFSQMRIPWKLVLVPIVLGLGTISAGMLPGSPSLVNVIPTRYLGTTLTALPVAGFLMSTLSVLLAALYMAFLARRAGNSAKEPNQAEESVAAGNRKLPGLFMSLLPIVFLIALILIGGALNIPHYFEFALILTVLLEVVLFAKYIPSHKALISSGISDSLMPLFNTAITVALGLFIADLGSIKPLTTSILNISRTKLIGLSLLAMLFSIIAGSGSGAMEIVTRNYSVALLSEGYAGEMIHRLTATASIIFTNTPHCGALLTLLSLTGIKHKDGFMAMYTGAVVTNLVPFLLLLLIA